ncbi:acyl-[acyl-carrier-protein] thioesterase [Algoriphagus sp.]|uniref:acyl-[acyl-carrier-protein] thioesterase n=1 Tax=Algoriphagus sp. TaxID=1872435 RepID=UPI00391C722D
MIPENLQYQLSYEVGSFQVHPDGNISLTSLADLLQEVAWRHADSADFGRNLLDNSQMWILSRLEIKVEKFPKWGDKIRLFTGGRGADKLFAFREFLVWDHNDQILARGMSSWLLVHAETKRIQKPESVLPAALFDPKIKPDWQPGKIVIKGELIASEEVKVRLADLDLYNHVNNTSYIRWVENLLFDQGIRPSSISINYLAESLEGESVLLSLFKNEKGYIIEGRVGAKLVFTSKV